MAARKDPAPWLLTASVALALGGMPLLLPPSPAQAQAPKLIMAGVTTTAAPAEDGDGDGDELLEHWGDARYAHEQRVQFFGLAAFFGAFGAVSYRRRAALRRSRRHD